MAARQSPYLLENAPSLGGLVGGNCFGRNRHRWIDWTGGECARANENGTVVNIVGLVVYGGRRMHGVGVNPAPNSTGRTADQHARNTCIPEHDSGHPLSASRALVSIDVHFPYCVGLARRSVPG